MVAKGLNDVEINEIWNQWSRAVKNREVIEAVEWARGVEDLVTTIHVKDGLITELGEDIAGWAKAAQQAINERNALDAEIKWLQKIEKTAKDMRIAQKLFADAVEDNDVSELERASSRWNKACNRLDTLLEADK